MSIFPFLAAPKSQPTESLPLLEEWAFDFSTGRMLDVDGRSQRVTGLEALKVWMYKAICTEKGRYSAYSSDYGSEVDTLIGGSYSLAAARAEAQRMVTEALLVSPYIKAVSRVDAKLSGDTLALSCEVDTVYGSAGMEVTI